MLKINSRGQLGNQLFQISNAINLSLLKKDFLFIYKSDHSFKAFKYFKFNIKFSENNWKTVISIWLYKVIASTNLKLYYLISKSISFHKNNVEINEDFYNLIEKDNLSSKNNNIIDGYFQSSFYFNNIKHIIKDLLEIKPVFYSKFTEKYNVLLKSKFLVMHFRRGDYLVSGDETLGGINLTLPYSYYHEALKQVSNIEEYNIIIIGDDLNNDILKEFNYLPNVSMVEDNEINHFQLILNANIAIISNSSFAWWAAFLNKNNNILCLNIG
ncbi:MAG: alpha-1,2-fucosyltransferase [Chitinophagales bacterium]